VPVPTLTSDVVPRVTPFVWSEDDAGKRRVGVVVAGRERGAEFGVVETRPEPESEPMFWLNRRQREQSVGPTVTADVCGIALVPGVANTPAITLVLPA